MFCTKTFLLCFCACLMHRASGEECDYTPDELTSYPMSPEVCDADNSELVEDGGENDDKIFETEPNESLYAEGDSKIPEAVLNQSLYSEPSTKETTHEESSVASGSSRISFDRYDHGSSLSVLTVSNTSVLIPPNVLKASRFYRKFHWVRFESKLKTSRPYITTVIEDIPDVAIMNSFAHQRSERPTMRTEYDSETNITNYISVMRRRTKKENITCVPYNYTGSPHVELMDQKELVDALASTIGSGRNKGTCVVVIFYSEICPFSAVAAPALNALPRVFPSLRVLAIDANKHPSLNTQYGIVAIPALILYHNGRAYAKHSDDDLCLLEFSKFIVHHTGLKPSEKFLVASTDFGGPLRSIPLEEKNFYLGIAWSVILAFIFAKISQRIL